MMATLAVFEFENIGRPWLWLVLIAAGAWVLYWTYRGIFQRSEQRLTWGLMGLRGFGLVLLVLALAKPTCTRQLDLIDPGRLAIIVDDSISMSLATPDGKSRYTRAGAAAQQIGQAVERADSDVAVEASLFDINGRPIDDELASEPAAVRTDLLRAMSQTTAQLRSKPLVGIVLISDGVDNTGQPNPAAVDETTVPVYTVGFRPVADAADIDLTVRHVSHPPRVLKDNQIKIDVQLTKKGGAAADATVYIKRGQEVFASQPVTFEAGNTQQTISLAMTPTQPGHFVYTASVVANGGELHLADNAHHFPLQVDADAIRVFYIEGHLRFEYTSLKRRLEDDPDVALVSVVRRVSPERLAADTGGDYLTRDRLENFDVVILGDMEADYLDAAEYEAVVQWVDGGGALLVLGGYASFGGNGFRATPLAAALPVVFADEPPYQSEQPFRLELTELGRRHPIFELTGDRVKDAAMWSTAPHLEGSALVRRAKSGADIFAVNPNFEVDGKPAVVVAAQRYGNGHTMVLGADTTWRWTRLRRVFGQADTLYARFWSQMLRWLSGKDTARDRPLIVLSTDRPDYEVGKGASIQVRRQSTPDRELGESQVKVQIVRQGQDDQAIDVALRTSSADPDTFTGEFYPRAGGRYEVIAELIEEGKPVANQTVEFLAHGSQLELSDPGTNVTLMQSIATASGGWYCDIDQVDQLPQRIERRQRQIGRIQRSEYWNSPALFILFLIVVTAEWVIRRRSHLV